MRRGPLTSHGKTCIQRQGKFWRTESQKHLQRSTYLPVGWVGGKDGARRAVRRHHRSPGRGGRGCPALRWWQHDAEDKFGERRVMGSKGPAGGLAMANDPRVPSVIYLSSVASAILEFFNVLSCLILVSTHGWAEWMKKQGSEG